jgi:hypothetical protein
MVAQRAGVRHRNVGAQKRTTKLVERRVLDASALIDFCPMGASLLRAQRLPFQTYRCPVAGDTNQAAIPNDTRPSL